MFLYHGLRCTGFRSVNAAFHNTGLNQILVGAITAIIQSSDDERGTDSPSQLADFMLVQARHLAHCSRE